MPAATSGTWSSSQRFVRRRRVGRSARHRPSGADVLRLAAHAVELHLGRAVCPGRGARAPVDRLPQPRAFAAGDGRRCRWALCRCAACLGWLDIPFNPANMIVLPLILGIGVDHGVHLVHRWRQQRGRFAARRHGGRRAAHRDHDHRQLRRADPGPASRTAKPRPGADAGRDDVPGLVDRVLPGAAGVADAQSAGRVRDRIARSEHSPDNRAGGALRIVARRRNFSAAGPRRGCGRRSGLRRAAACGSGRVGSRGTCSGSRCAGRFAGRCRDRCAGGVTNHGPAPAVAPGTRRGSAAAARPARPRPPRLGPAAI